MDGMLAIGWVENVTNSGMPIENGEMKSVVGMSNDTLKPTNSTHHGDNAFTTNSSNQIINNEFVQGTFCVLYIAIFMIGIFGNVLVCYVVFRNKAMHTVTNFFITNLALSDILLCILAVPFTPLYTFLSRWIFGRALCHLVSYAQGVSVYISTLTLTSIAMDRFIVIIYPFRHRMKLSTCMIIITSIWIVSLILTFPYGMYMALNKNYEPNPEYYYCEEDWPSENTRKIYGTFTVILQFILPFVMITICYVWVSFKLNDRARTKPGSKTSKKEEADRERKKRTNRMLISMVGVFGLSWLPLNLANILNDFYETKEDIFTLLFFVAHCIAMSSTCYNPFLYAWLNENFRKEFKQVLPFFQRSGSGFHIRTYRPDRTFCNGNDGREESLLPPQSTKVTEIIPRGPTFNDSVKKPPKLNIQKNEGFDMNDVQHQQQIINDQPKYSGTKILSSGVLETPFDVITLSADQKNIANNNIAENL